MRLSQILIFLLLFLTLHTPKCIAQTASSQDSVYQRMIEMKPNYPEGLRWTNNNSYRSKAGPAGLGCHAFALLLSDAAFGTSPIRMHKNLDQLQVGDMIRLNRNTHTVIVLKIDSLNVTLAEGNYNKSVHWGRTMRRENLPFKANYILTRYPEETGLSN